MTDKNQLYFGDNLDVLGRYVADESVDLVYLDPPFNSNASYNVLFKEHDGAKAASQIKAFEDTWRWDEGAARAYQEVVEAGGKLSETLQAFRKLVGESDMLAYLSMMAPRLQELRRVLKPTGSIYLHCDPTASHYLKLLMDAVFGPQNFRSEIVWRRSRGHSDKSLAKYGANHDVIMFYSKTDTRVFNRQYHRRSSGAPKTHDLYRHTDGKLYRKGDCLAPGGRGPEYEWNGFVAHWRFTQEEAKRLEAAGRIVYSKSGRPRILRPVDLSRGHPLQDTWIDIDPPNAGSGELLGYPTQKPEALLERIVSGSSNEGDVVLDPFCGCGTTIDSAQKLGRRWIGIDITHLAINLIRHRLQDTYGEEINETYDVIGEPTSEPDARDLAKQDPYQFQWWALGLVGARPVEQKKGADKGIDGRLYFHDDPNTRKTKQIIFSVKAGKTNVAHVRDLCHVVDREQAEMGVLISMHANTKPMRAEAADTGFYESPWGKHPKIQLLTVAELLKGGRIDMPPAQGVNVTFKKAPKASPKAVETMELLLQGDGDKRKE